MRVVRSSASDRLSTCETHRFSAGEQLVTIGGSLTRAMRWVSLLRQARAVIARSASDEAIQCVAVLDRFALLAMTSKKASIPDRRFHEPTRVAKKLAQRLVAIGGFNRRRFPVRPLSHGERGYGLS